MDVTSETFEREVLERSHELRGPSVTEKLIAELGHEHPLTVRHERRLAAILY